jgi:hypothetical protein
MSHSAQDRQSGAVRRWLVPSLVDVFFCAMLLTVGVRPGGWQSFLFDGDTGWHIRTGEIILSSGSVPTTDPFSFTRPGERWFAWEWLSDVVFARVWRAGGLRAVAALTAVAVSLAAALVLGRLLRRGAGLGVGLAVTLAAASASSVHSLARPHVFSVLFYAAALWALEEDRRKPGPALWALVPLCTLWANVHGGFVVLPATLGLCAVVDRSWRYLGAALAAGAASCLNPYGWQLHAHIARYLNSSWILDHVQEFQSPSIRSENMLIFAAMLLATAAVAFRGDRFEGLLAVAWGFASMRSARHIPLFAVAAAPVLAEACAGWWRQKAEAAPATSAWRLLWQTSLDLGRRPAATVWLGVAGIVAVAPPGVAAVEFPEQRFPVAAVERNVDVLAEANAGARVLTSDQWADYLIYRLYPRQKVFFDGRSDFYGPALGTEYRELLGGRQSWREVMQRHGFDRALLPRDWPLSTVLDREPGWRRLYEDGTAVLFVREERP